MEFGEWPHVRLVTASEVLAGGDLCLYEPALSGCSIEVARRYGECRGERHAGAFGHRCDNATGARVREDDMNRHIYRLTAGLAGCLAVVLAGCGAAGTSPQTAPRPAASGLESQTAAQVAQAAYSALKAAASVHVRGTFFTARRTE